MGWNRPGDRREALRTVRRQRGWLGQSYFPEMETSTEVRQGRCSACLVLHAAFSLFKLPTTTTRIRLWRINEFAQENRHKIHLQQSRKKRNWKPNAKFLLMHIIHNAHRDHGDYN